MSVATDVWIDAHDERESLLGLLETLTPFEWNMQSPCAEWRVRDGKDYCPECDAKGFAGMMPPP